MSTNSHITSDIAFTHKRHIRSLLSSVLTLAVLVADSLAAWAEGANPSTRSAKDLERDSEALRILAGEQIEGKTHAIMSLWERSRNYSESEFNDLETDFRAYAAGIEDSGTYDYFVTAIPLQVFSPRRGMNLVVELLPMDNFESIQALVSSLGGFMGPEERAEAEDLAADALFRAYKALEQYEPMPAAVTLRYDITGALARCGVPGFDRMEELGFPRERLIRAWGYRGSGHGTEDLLGLLSDSKQTDEARFAAVSRLAAMDVWGSLDPEDQHALRESLIGFLEHEQWGYRRRAAQMAGRVPDAALVSYLDRMSKLDPHVREVFRSKTVDGQRIQETAPVYEVREAAAEALEKLQARLEREAAKKEATSANE